MHPVSVVCFCASVCACARARARVVMPLSMQLMRLGRAASGVFEVFEMLNAFGHQGISSHLWSGRGGVWGDTGGEGTHEAFEMDAMDDWGDWCVWGGTFGREYA